MKSPNPRKRKGAHEEVMWAVVRRLASTDKFMCVCATKPYAEVKRDGYEAGIPVTTPNPTPEMDSRELDAQIAEKIFGWRWFAWPNSRTSKKWLAAILPPDDGVGVRWNFPAAIAEDVTDRIGEFERYSDWWKCGQISESMPIGLPKFSTDPVAMMLVVEKMRELDLWVNLELTKKGYDASFCNTDPDFCREGSATEATAPLAVCRAALLAVGQERGSE